MVTYKVHASLYLHIQLSKWLSTEVGKLLSGKVFKAERNQVKLN